MMTTGHGSGRAGGPFGYSFSEPSHSSSSYPPPGPPLLDNNESGMLDNFFENPNNVDPTFLSVAGHYQNDGSGSFNHNNSLEWMNHGSNMTHSSAAMAQPGRSVSQANSQQSRQGQGNYRPGLEHRNSIPTATDDVHAAASLLYTSQAGRLPVLYSGYGGNLMGDSQEASSTNGYSYPPMPSPTTGQYDFDAASAANGLYSLGDVRGRYVAGTQPQRLPARVQRVDAQGTPVRFGTDDLRFSEPNREEREKKRLSTWVEMYDPGPVLGDAGEAGPQEVQSTIAPQKRRRGDSDGEGDSEDYQSSDDEDHRAIKRRRSKFKDEDEEDFDNGSNGAKNGRRQPSAQSKNARRSISSPTKNKKSSPSDSKAQRENLTEEQKRNNHIQSEQKRRNLIKQGFEDINKMVPDLRSGGFSKSSMLVEAAKFLKRLTEENDELRKHIRTLDTG